MPIPASLVNPPLSRSLLLIGVYNQGQLWGIFPVTLSEKLNYFNDVFISEGDYAAHYAGDSVATGKIASTGKWQTKIGTLVLQVGGFA